MNTENINKLLKLLSQSKDLSLDKQLTFISSDLVENKNLLDDLGIKFNDLREGIEINLAEQSILIYKTKADCIKHFQIQTELDKKIIIIEDKIIYDKSKTCNVFFENLIYSQKIQKLIENQEVISFNDKINKRYFLLSEKNGKIKVGYKNKPSDFFDKSHNLKKLYDSLNQNLSNEYIAFFRDNIIKSVEDEKEINDRFFYLLSKLELIIEKTNREYNLFLHKFSFEEFYSKLEEEKDKYFKNFQDLLSDFLSKVNSMPIQFGAYIYLLFRFEKEIFPLIIISIIIIAWSSFSFFSINAIKNNIDNLSQRFNNVFDKISEKSGIDLKSLEKEQNGIDNRLKNIKILIMSYQRITFIFAAGFLILAYYFIAQIYPCLKIWFI